MGSPALLDAQATHVLEILNEVHGYLQNHVAHGGVVTDGGTTQASGANTAPNFDIDVSGPILGVVKGRALELAAQTDADANAGDTVVWGATSGKSVVFGVVFSGGSDGGTAAIVAVPGAVADTGDEVPPTDERIAEVLGHENFRRIANVTLNRTGDTAVSVAIDHTVRFDGLRYRSPLAVTEADFRDQNGAIIP